MELVDDDEFEARKEAAPPRVVGEQAGVQHVGVGHHDVAAFSDRGAPSGRCVAVVGIHPDLDREARLQRAELGQLVLGERLGWIYVQRAFFRVLEQALKNGEVVAECLSARGRCDHHQVPAAPHSVVCLGLVGVESLDATPRESRDQLGAEVGRQRHKIGGGCGNHVVQRYVTWELGWIEPRS